MSIDQLIDEVLNNIRNHWYADRAREFKRDQRALMMAVLRYGHECNLRDWQFDADFIFRELMTLLKQIRTKGADIQYLPVYLDGAITRSLGQRAEELSALAKSKRTAGKLAAKAVAGVQVAAIREPTAVETCSAVFTALQRIGKARRKASRSTKAVQEDLL